MQWQYVLHIFCKGYDDYLSLRQIGIDAGRDVFGWDGELAEAQGDGFVEISPGVWGNSLPATEELRQTLVDKLTIAIVSGAIVNRVLLRRIAIEDNSLIESYSITPSLEIEGFGDVTPGEVIRWGESKLDASLVYGV